MEYMVWLNLLEIMQEAIQVELPIGLNQVSSGTAGGKSFDVHLKYLKTIHKADGYEFHSKNKDALSGNLLVGDNSSDALIIGGTRGARYIRLGYSVRPLAAF